MAIRESVHARMAASPETVFGLITNPWLLPSWNRAITAVVDAPAQLEPGSEWKVSLHALSQTWVSRSQVSAIDPASRFFSYRSQTDDGNPSYADWEWQIDSEQDGSKVTVTVELHPTTFLRKHILIKLRRPALRREMVASLSALDAATSQSPT
jgi:uncharacterized protein YndB with AHSA1/START domain